MALKQLRPFSDDRLHGWCAYCGGSPETRDHIPPKAFLDSPYPQNLPVVGSCRSCNAGSSADEEYLACLIECVLRGSTDPDRLSRPKVARTLRVKPTLANRIAREIRADDERKLFSAVADRVARVVLKLARGHASYEFSEPRFEDLARIEFAPIVLLSPEQRGSFELAPSSGLWPEVGSRAFVRAVKQLVTPGTWINVQPARYRYLAADAEGVLIRVILSEYLCCAVYWE